MIARPALLRHFLLKAFLLPLLFHCVSWLQAAPEPKDWSQPPLVVVSQTVNVSVGEKMALVIGQYWLQYVSKFDDADIKTISIYYPVFVPKEVVTLADLREASQAKLVLGDTEYAPAEGRVLEVSELGETQALPEDANLAMLVFKIPRDRARLRFDVMISHFQPLYQREGKTVAAFLPWLPNLDALRREMELKDPDFLITFDALPGVVMEPLSHNEKVRKRTPKQLVVHPIHGETIAVALQPEAPAQPKAAP